MFFPAPGPLERDTLIHVFARHRPAARSGLQGTDGDL